MSEDFMELVKLERTRIRESREALLVHHQETEDQLAGLNRELAALDAYEFAKTGQRPKGRMLSLPAPTKGAKTRTRQNSKRESVLVMIQGTPGIRRGELLDKMGLRGDKSGEMSVSNSLTALVQKGSVRREAGGKYFSQH